MGINWKPQDIADLASQLSRIGNDYRTAIADAYNAFNQIGVNLKWVGKNYNVIANNVLNHSKPKFEEWADFIQNYIPQQVYIVADKYAQYESISFTLAVNSYDIQNVQETEDRGDGSLKIQPDEVRSDLNENIPTYCDNAVNSLSAYIREFDSLESIEGAAAILKFRDGLEEILESSKAFVKEFLDELKTQSENAIAGIEITDEETKAIAERVLAAMGV